MCRSHIPDIGVISVRPTVFARVKMTATALLSVSIPYRTLLHHRFERLNFIEGETACQLIGRLLYEGVRSRRGPYWPVMTVQASGGMSKPPSRRKDHLGHNKIGCRAPKVSKRSIARPSICTALTMARKCQDALTADPPWFVTSSLSPLGF